MTSPSPENSGAPPPHAPEASSDATGAASTALTVSILSLLTAPLWIIAGLFFGGGGLIVAVIPGALSIALSFRALQLAQAATSPLGTRRGIVSLVLGLLASIISVISAVAGVAISGVNVGKMDGRALRIRGRTVTAQGTRDAEWAVAATPAVSGQDEATRAMLATEWEVAARTEHASVAAFARLSLDLMAAGAPPHLLEASLTAALEEVRHATGAYSLASAYAGRHLGPGPIPEVATAPGGLARLATETVLDGCLGEGLAAACAREAAAEATDPVIRAHLSAVAREEGGHAELAWAVLAFCLERGGAAARRATERALEISARGALPPTCVGGSELAGDRQERELVVGLAQAAGEQAHDVPQDLVGEVFVQKEQIVEAIFGDGEQAAALVHAGVGAAGRVVEQRHLAEDGARAEHGERLFAHARHLAADAHAAFENQIEPVADVAVPEDDVVLGVLFFVGDVRDERQGVGRQPPEESDRAELFDGAFVVHAGRRRWGRPRGDPGSHAP